MKFWIFRKINFFSRSAHSENAFLSIFATFDGILMLLIDVAAKEFFEFSSNLARRRRKKRLFKKWKLNSEMKIETVFLLFLYISCFFFIIMLNYSISFLQIIHCFLIEFKITIYSFDFLRISFYHSHKWHKDLQWQNF